MNGELLMREAKVLLLDEPFLDVLASCVRISGFGVESLGFPRITLIQSLCLNLVRRFGIVPEGYGISCGGVGVFLAILGTCFFGVQGVEVPLLSSSSTIVVNCSYTQRA